MKQRYLKKSYTKTLSIKLTLLFFLFLCINIGYSQVRVPFAPRTSIFTPSQTNYTVKGDFMMIGNTNLELAGYTYPTNASNSNDMKYVDIDGDSNTWNSSSANLTFSTENGAVPDCSKIIYAGLYWTGRAFGPNESDSEIFQVSKTGSSGGATETKTFDKRKVSIKGPLASTYTELEADGISFPTGNADRNMYSAYTEVTEYVRENGIGDYFVADIALREGIVDATGYYGGWGMVVVYENSKMKWRDITVFDGHAYVNNNYDFWPINVSGFSAVQNGDVNLKLGIMAGEGDILWTGDTFQMLRQDTGVYENLAHSNNSPTNFFNSSIITGGTPRNPNYQNNTGLDIVMFDVDNENNKYITNNQTSTSFRYGSGGGDTYTIFNITFSVDAYIPEPEAILSLTSVNTAGSTPGVLLPGENADYKIDIKNKGTEATNNTIITVPVPYTSSYEELSISYNVYAPLTTDAVPYYDPNVGATGSIIWNLGTLPVPNNPDDILADLSFKLSATTDCSLLVNASCSSNISLNGTIAGTGATSNTVFNQALIQGYQSTGSCVGEPIPTPLLVNIDSDAYIAANCGSYAHVRDFYYCNIGSTPIQTSQVSAAFPAGTKYYNEYPKTDTTIEYNASKPFPSTVGTTLYYAIPPGATACYYEFSINVSDISSVPTVQNITYCLNETASPLTAIPSDAPTAPSAYTLYYYVDNNPATPAQTSIVPLTSTAGEITYYVAEGYSISCISQTRVPITVTVSDGTAEITAPATIDIEDCDENSITAVTARYPFSLTESADIKDTYVATGYTASVDNTISSITYIDVINPNSSCPLTVTRTFKITNSCGTTNTAEQIISVNDSTGPSIINTNISNLEIDCSAGNTETSLTAWLDTNAGATASDSCSDVTWSNDYDSTISVKCSDGPITVTFTATDACGNMSTITSTYLLKDEIAPIITNTLGDLDKTVECSDVNDLNAALALSPTATDDCAVPNIILVSDVTTNDANCSSAYVRVRTWNFTDGCNTSDDFVQTITVVDSTAPIPATTFDTTLNVSCANIPDAPTLTFTDNCSSASSITTVFSETSTFEENVYDDYVITRTWTVKDACDNEAVYEQIINVFLDEIVTDFNASDWCYDEGSLNLNGLLPNGLNTDGTWELVERGDTSATLNGNIFDATLVTWNSNSAVDGFTYIFKYTTTNNGCISVSNITMKVIYCQVLPCGENDIKISKAVTPNGDAYNESFDISGIELCGFRTEVQIFNRWGALIFESNNYTVGENLGDWKGAVSKASIGSAKEVPNGTYYYIIKLKNPISGELELNPITGPVYLGTK